MPHDKNMHQCTMHGLQHWFEAKFEKLGWMAVAKEHGNTLKVRSYLQSVSHLKECIKDKISTVHDLDRKDDLKIMLDHTETLSTAAHKLLDSELPECSKRNKHTMTDAQEATFYGLHKWEMKIFERLGWMVLAKNERNSLKIRAYFQCIHTLKSSLHKKMEDVEEKDRKDDLKILYDQACILWRSATKLLGKPEGMGSMSSMHSGHSVASVPSVPSMKTGSKTGSKTQKKMSKGSKNVKRSKKSKNEGSVFGGLF